MRTVRTIAETRVAVAAARSAGRRIGLVPTMGALHAGHLSLIEAARREGCFVVVSIFVNPTQFGPSEDFARYPRDEVGDLRLCEQAGVELVFAPDVAEMYPAPPLTTVGVARISGGLCGRSRPGHFEGVATVVAKLFHIVGSDAAYFGEKDAQQLAVIRRMTRDLNFEVAIVGCPTLREPDGLALSSRNRYLSPAQRAQAPCLYAALTAASRMIASGTRASAALTAAMRNVIAGAGEARLDYAEVVDAESFEPVERVTGRVVIALAAHLGATRLIDNVTVDPDSGAG